MKAAGVELTELEFLKRLLALLQEGHYKLLFMELKQEMEKKEVN